MDNTLIITTTLLLFLCRQFTSSLITQQKIIITHQMSSSVNPHHVFCRSSSHSSTAANDELIDNTSTSTATNTNPTLTTQHDNDKESIIVQQSGILQYAHFCGALKQTPRTGWVRRGIPNVESVADHSWRVAALSLLLIPSTTTTTTADATTINDNNSATISMNENNKHDNSSIQPTMTMDVSKCMQMAILHDLAESIVGDIAPSDNIPKETKQQMEHDAIHQIADSLGNYNSNAKQYLLSLYQEYEQRQTNEAIAVKDLDLLDMIIQADEYETLYPHIDLSEFFRGTPPSRFQNECIRRVAEEVHEQRKVKIEQRDENKTMSYERNQTMNNNNNNGDTTITQNTDCNKSNSTSGATLSETDRQFVESISSKMNISSSDIEKIVLGLRHHDSTDTVVK